MSRIWSQLQNQSLAKKLTYLRTEDITAYSKELITEAAGSLNQFTSYEALLLFRRLIILHFRSNEFNVQDAIVHCRNLLTEFLILQQGYAPDEFQKSKLAIAQAFCISAPSLKRSSQEFSRFLDGIHSLVRS